jgi:hypothetical protein
MDLKYKGMNGLKVILLAATFITLAVIGCIPEPLEVDGIRSIKPEIVVSTQMIPDQSLAVLLTRSFGALDANEESDPESILASIAINDAIVSIHSANSSDTLLFLGNGLYGGVNIEFEAGKEYTLIAESTTLGRVTSTTTVRERVEFEDVDTDIFVNEFSDTTVHLSYKFTDPAGPNSYVINIVEIDREDLIEDFLAPREYTKLIKDENDDETEYGDLIRLSTRYDPGDTVAVYLSNVNDDYYDFIELHHDSRFSLTEYLSEPLNYPTNVEGGRGFFNLYLPDIEILIIE